MVPDRKATQIPGQLQLVTETCAPLVLTFSVRGKCQSSPPTSNDDAEQLTKTVKQPASSSCRHSPLTSCPQPSSPPHASTLILTQLDGSSSPDLISCPHIPSTDSSDSDSLIFIYIPHSGATEPNRAFQLTRYRTSGVCFALMCPSTLHDCDRITDPAGMGRASSAR